MDDLPGPKVKALKSKFPNISSLEPNQKTLLEPYNFFLHHFDLLIDSQPGRVNQFADSS